MQRDSNKALDDNTRHESHPVNHPC